MQTTLTAKQGATGRVCASRMGKEQSGNKYMDGCWQHCLLSASWDTATAHTLRWTQPRQYVWWSQRWRENTLQEQSMGWLGYEAIFFPGFGWKREWHSSLSPSGLFLITPLTALQAADPCSATAQWEKQHKLLLSTSVFLLLKICTNRALFCF